MRFVVAAVVGRGRRGERLFSRAVFDNAAATIRRNNARGPSTTTARSSC